MRLLRRIVLTYLAAMCLGGAAFATVGFLWPISAGKVLGEPATARALELAFRGEVGSGASWSALRGTTSRGWLFRRAYVQGRSAAGIQYSEQVLKVGWPFTMARGFVRVVGAAVQPEGALAVRGDPTPGPVRFVPVQPVWPGVIIDSGVLAVVMLSAGGAWKRRPWRKPPLRACR